MKIIKLFFKLLLTLVLFVFCYIILSQGFTQIFEKQQTREFVGDKFYNPYLGIDSIGWSEGFLKSNLHGHTNFDTHEPYTTQQYGDAYVQSGYDVINISDHNFITPALSDASIASLDSYEHGYNLNNFHQLMMGVAQNDMFDIPLMFMPRHQMQTLINRLEPQAALFQVNHPERLRLMNKDHAGDIRGFQVMELNTNADSRYWDLQLHSGNYIVMICNDDAHSIANRNSAFQRAYTMVYSPERQIDSVIVALKAARSYGVVVDNARNMLGPHSDMPTMKSFDLQGDSVLRVAFSQKASSIRFVSGFQTLSEIKDSTSAEFLIPSSLPYLRIEATFPNGVRIFTNALARSADAMQPEVIPSPLAIAWLTWLNRIAWFVLGIFLFIKGLALLWRKRGKNKRSSYTPFESTRWGGGSTY